MQRFRLSIERNTAFRNTLRAVFAQRSFSHLASRRFRDARCQRESALGFLDKKAARASEFIAPILLYSATQSDNDTQNCRPRRSPSNSFGQTLSLRTSPALSGRCLEMQHALLSPLLSANYELK